MLRSEKEIKLLTFGSDADIHSIGVPLGAFSTTEAKRFHDRFRLRPGAYRTLTAWSLHTQI